MLSINLDSENEWKTLNKPREPENPVDKYVEGVLQNQETIAGHLKNLNEPWIAKEQSQTVMIG